MNTHSELLRSVQDARRRLATSIRVTPCLRAPLVTGRPEIELWLKREDMQRTGSFKERGARHALLCLSPEARRRGVVAASAGNHALGLAYHGAQLGIRVVVVMPESAPAVKVNRCRSLGAEVVVAGRSYDESQGHARHLAETQGLAPVHAFDDPAVIAGQGTVALEVLEQCPNLEVLVLPVGGGGLLGGCAAVVKALRPQVKVVAVEPLHAASFASSFRSGSRTPVALRPTLADGLSVSVVGNETFARALPYVDHAVTVTEDELARAVAHLARTTGVVEGAGAAATAAVLAGKTPSGRTVAAVTGRNIDASRHSQIVAETSLLPAEAAA